MKSPFGYCLLCLSLGCSTSVTTTVEGDRGGSSSKPNAGAPNAGSMNGRAGAAGSLATSTHAGQAGLGIGAAGSHAGGSNYAGSGGHAGAEGGGNGVAGAGFAGSSSTVDAAGAGSSATGGGANANSGGTNANSGGTNANNGGAHSGGTSQSFGGVANAGTTVQAGAAGSPRGGAAGAGNCTSNAECAALNPEPYSCSAVCQAGHCKVSVDITKIGSRSSGHVGPVTGTWDAAARPWVIAAAWKQTGQNATLVMQQIRADGAASGVAATYELPNDVLQPSYLTAFRRGERLGVLWSSTLQPPMGGPRLVTQMVDTTLSAAPATPVTLMSLTGETPYPETVYGLGLGPSGTSDWVVAQFSGTPRAWRGYAGSLSLVPTYLPGLTNGPQNGDPAFVLFGDTVVLAGHDCTTYANYTCKPQLILNRYSSADFSLIGSSIQVSTTAYDASGTGNRNFSPALGSFGGRLFAFWNENGPSGLLLGRATLSALGNYEILPFTSPTDLRPKAIAGAATGGGILFAERLTGVGGNTELVAQEFDATLTLVGQIYVLNNANADPPDSVEAHPSTDGRILLTFRHGDARYSLLHAGLCH